MPDHIFLLEKFGVPPVTISISELWAVLVSQELGTTEWPVRILPDEMGRYFDPVEKALNVTEDIMIKSLSSSSLIAHSYNENDLNLYKIPQSYWTEEFATNSLHGHLFDTSPGHTYPTALDGCAVVIVSANAVSWLTELNIAADSSYFPATLGNNGNRQFYNGERKGRPMGYAGQWCLAIAKQILTERGGISPEFKQIHLIKEIYERRPKNWHDSEPSEASMKRYAREAISQFYQNDSDDQNTKKLI